MRYTCYITSHTRTYCCGPRQTLGSLPFAFITITAPRLDGMPPALVMLGDGPIQLTVYTHAVLLVESRRLVKPEHVRVLPQVQYAVLLGDHLPAVTPDPQHRLTPTHDKQCELL